MGGAFQEVKPVPKQPEYLRVATTLLQRIQDGAYPPGHRLPSLAEVEDEFGVSQETSTKAYRWLVGEGHVLSRVGKGHYASTPASDVRDTRRWYKRGDGSPFRAEQAARGQRGDWDCHSERREADDRIAERLGIDPGDPVMFSQYTFRSDGQPKNLSESWEPLAITAGTPIEWPEEGVSAGRGVLDRMAMIGIDCHRAEEWVSSRRATTSEAERLQIPDRSPVLTVQRTYYFWDQGTERAAETADIVYPSGYTAIYEVPVRDAD